MQRLERQILDHDTEIDPPARALPVAAPASESTRPAAATAPLERRRVTVLFAALAATNEADEDPEQTAAFFDRLHAEAAAEIEAAGGTVEKGLVGALLATFGNNDHATQAARAALATQRKLMHGFGDALSLRMALESGEVIVGRDSLVMGTPVAASARLVGLAQPGDIVVGHRAGRALEGSFELRERGQAHVLVEARAHPVAREVRKNVTVLFSDLVDSTRLGHELEPEALSMLMSEYFRAMELVVARHGGIVEKFIGDAVMAVFGVPVLHEDDALRAVRTAAEMRESLAALNETFETTWGMRLQARIGINSGEVMAGDHLQGHLIVTGRAVTAAKRFEEAAAADEILISEVTHRLVRDAVVAERVSDRVVKGGETLEGYAIAEVRPHTAGRARRFDTPLVDREQEYGALLNAFESVVETRECHLLTVLGEAGVGKSRLVQEFAREVGAEATVLRGSCLPYGEGITYWPLAEVVRDMLGAEPSSAAIAALLPHEERADLIAELISEALGLSGTNVVGSEQTFWAVRRLFESLAETRPLVVVFDDLQWAEPTFIDLVDYVADHTRDAPVLLLCVARPELFDTRPDWGGGKRHAAATSLEPLRDDDTRRLIANLLGGDSVPDPVQKRIADLAEGNALFTEELLAMLVDEERLVREDERWVVAGDLGDLRIPQEISAFLAARLERLPEGERTLLVRGSVEGAVFHYGALRELSPELSESVLHRDLASLVRRDLIRPDRASISGDEAYRFRHLLIRDAAFDSLSKATRADHARAVCRVARTRSRHSDPRVRGDRRLPPGAGVPLPRRPSPGRGAHGRRRARFRAARVRRAPRPRAQRSSGRDRTAGASDGVARRGRAEARAPALRARRGADRRGRRRARGGSGTRAHRGQAHCVRSPRRTRGFACAGSTAIPAALACRAPIHRRSGSSRGERCSRLRAPRRSARSLHSAPARGTAAMERGACGTSGRSLGAARQNTRVVQATRTREARS